jgi:hypothetical protein
MFFSICKSQFVVHRAKIYQKNLQKKNQDGRDFQDGVCTFLLYENMFCERSIRYIELIFGVSRYYLITNVKK